MPSERIQRKIDSLLDEAESALTRNDWQAVIERAKAVLALDPNNEDASHYREAAQRGASEESRAAATAGPSKTGATTPTIADRPFNLPSSFASGRYLVKKFLGEGGKKRVFLAHDITLDRDVAFALIKAEGLDEAARRRILREAQAMGRLGDHPNIVPIFDLGTEAGQPYLVIPFMQGGDVADLIEGAKDHRPPLEDVLRIASDVCEGLAFAHSKGLVHRDLKPGNVWLTERGQAKIGDFGLALPLDQSRLTREGFMVGTVAYMPPEQAMGGEITPRADLYSLGAMLYEMVTGRPPFLGDDDIAVISQHINTPPVAPAWHRPDCPKPLDALIMRLLAKDSKQRPESAKDVLAALEGIDLSTAAPQPSQQADGKQGGKSLDSVSSGVFVGRQKEMDQLRAALEETLSGHGRMVTLAGEPGIGKTRTAQALQTYAGLRRAQTLWGRCYEGGGAPPYWPWIQAIRQYVRERPAEELKREMGSTASVIAEVVSDVKERIPGIQPPPQLDSPESARFRLFDSIATFLKTASQTQTLVLVLDDLHWSDKPSLLLLEFVAREIANARVLLVGTYRDVELNRKHPLAVTLGDLTKDRLFERVLLRGLQKHDVERFIEIASGMKPLSGLVDAVHTQTEGNPLFVTEVVRWLVQEGALTREKTADKKSWSMPIPEGVRDVIGKRLDRLSPRCNDVLTTASVIGRRFAMTALTKLYADETLPIEERLTENRLLDLLEEALGARIVEELPSGPGRYVFSHALIQETLAKELSTTRKVRLHARIALVLEDLYKDRLEERAAELAEHFAEAETLLGTEKLVTYSLIAGQRALAAVAPHEAEIQFMRGLASAADAVSVEKAELLVGLGAAQMHTLQRFDMSKAVETLNRATEMFLSLGLKNRALSACLVQVPQLRDLTGTLDLLETGLKLVGRGTADEARLLSNLGLRIYWERGDYDTAVSQLSEALSLALRLGAKQVQLHALAHVVLVHSANGRADSAESAAAQVEPLLEQVDDRASEIPLRHVLYLRAMEQGDLTKAKEHSRKASALADRLKVSHLTATACLLESSVATVSGDWSAARNSLERGLIGDPVENRLLGIKVVIDALTGNPPGARQALDLLWETLKPSLARATSVHAWWARSVAVYWDLTGDPHLSSEAMEAAERVVAHPTRELVAKSYAWGALAKMALLKGDLTAVKALAGDAESAESGGLFDGGGWAHLSPLARVRAETATALGHFAEAEPIYRKLLASYARVLHKPLAALISNDYSEMLVTRNDAGDRDRALKLQDEALSIARELGMKPLIERILRRREILGA